MKKAAPPPPATDNRPIRSIACQRPDQENDSKPRLSEVLSLPATDTRLILSIACQRPDQENDSNPRLSEVLSLPTTDTRPILSIACERTDVCEGFGAGAGRQVMAVCHYGRVFSYWTALSPEREVTWPERERCHVAQERGRPTQKAIFGM
ncbi:hypothetical protein T484DRAFT_1754271 [Baffinella frigidus]|nr:hypothetical protein T484DRAFT_1754271 [Cryptophyta sp. CCMP2293]